MYRNSSFLFSAVVAQAVQGVLAVALETKYVGSVPTIGIFLYVARAVERVLAVALGNKLCWFESQYRHISLCSPGSSTRVGICLGKHITLVRVPQSSYFFM